MLIGTILLIAVIFVVFMIAMFLRGGNILSVLIDQVENVHSYSDDRWSRRVEYGERLVSSGRFQKAVYYLTALDQDFPAKNVKYKRDIERERLLQALGHSFAELGKKRRSLNTYRRLVEFDPRNFNNHYLLAMNCVRFNEYEEADEQFRQVLAIHPTHLPSLKGYVSIHFNRGDFGKVIDAFEVFMNAFQVQNVTVALGDLSTTVGVQVDGNWHDIEVRLRQKQGWAGTLAIYSGGLSVEIEHVMLKAPVLIGEISNLTSHIWSGETSWQTKEMECINVESYRSLGNDSVARLDLQVQPQGVDKICIRLRLFKKYDKELWNMVDKSYHNMLDIEGLTSVRNRMIEINSL
jgi:tetratricopeptide (TPR) repeat protein